MPPQKNNTKCLAGTLLQARQDGNGAAASMRDVRSLAATNGTFTRRGLIMQRSWPKRHLQPHSAFPEIILADAQLEVGPGKIQCLMPMAFSVWDALCMNHAGSARQLRGQKLADNQARGEQPRLGFAA